MKVLVQTNGTIQEALVSAVGGTGVTTVDFGSTGNTSTTTVITGQAGIIAGSTITASCVCIATATHTDDEHWFDGPRVMAGTIVPGTGFTIYAFTPNKALYGLYSVSWSWT